VLGSGVFKSDKIGVQTRGEVDAKANK
jgi:hypothetical protein